MTGTPVFESLAMPSPLFLTPPFLSWLRDRDSAMTLHRPGGTR